METSRPPAERLLFLDNVRYLVILCVVIFHTAVGYAGLPEFFMETNTSPFFTYVRHMLFIFMMPTLFFVAGYFALPSLRGRSYGLFMRRKIARLGIPWLLGVLFLGPTMPYLGYYSQSFNGLSSGSYWDFWTAYVQSGLDRWKIDTAFNTNPLFHHQHFWFLAALLELFAIFALVHAAWKKWGRSRDDTTAGDGGSAPSATRVLIAASLLMAIGQGMNFIFDFPGGTYAFFFILSVNQLFGSGGFFALGVYAQARGWFAGGPVPGMRAFWRLLVLWVAVGGTTLGMYSLWRETIPQALLISFGSVALHLLIAWFLVILLGLTHRYMNRPSAVNAKLAANSYNVYLLQYPAILFFRLLLLPWDASAFVKFGIVLALTLGACYALSEYLIRPFPRLSVACLIGGSALLFIFGPPRSAYSHLLLERRDELHTVVHEQSPERLLEALPETDESVFSWGAPTARICRSAGDLYVAYGAGGLHALRADGAREVLDAELQLGDIASLPEGALAAIELGTGRIVELSSAGEVVGALVDSADSTGASRFLASDASGGIYFSTEAPGEGGGKVWYRCSDGALQVALEDDELKNPGVLALSADGSRLFPNDAESADVRVFDVGADGTLSGGESFAEVFLADGRYGQPRPGPVESPVEGMIADREGRLYAATRFGLQVFSLKGRLLGVVNFPVPPDWQPKHPINCVFDEEDMSTLYVACGDEVFAVRTSPRGRVDGL